jgi:hypothetical protein
MDFATYLLRNFESKNPQIVYVGERLTAGLGTIPAPRESEAHKLYGVLGIICCLSELTARYRGREGGTVCRGEGNNIQV